jgi:hypothetical protein
MSKPFIPVAAAVLLHAALLGAFVAAYHGDVSALVCLDEQQTGIPPYEAVRVGFPSGGYDGQFYYAIARDPWRRHLFVTEFGAFRHQRLLYPALGWLISGGDARRLLWALPAINLAAVGGLAWLGVRLARHYGTNVWWGFVLPLAVNDGLPLLRDLTDPLATFAVCGLLAGWLLGWADWQLVLWATAAAFSREQNVAIILVVLAAALWTRRRGATVALAVVLLLWLGWFCLLRVAYGGWPLPPAGDYYFGTPFKGMLFRWSHLDYSGSRLSGILHLLRMVVLTLHLGLALYLAARTPDRVVSIVALGGVALAVLTGVAAYGDAWSYTRVFVWVPLAVWLASVRLRRPRPLWLLLPAALWPLITVAAAWHTGRA